MELEQVLWLSSGGGDGDGGGGNGGGFSTSQFQEGCAFDHGLQISEATNNSDIQIQQPLDERFCYLLIVSITMFPSIVLPKMKMT